MGPPAVVPPAGINPLPPAAPGGAAAVAAVAGAAPVPAAPADLPGNYYLIISPAQRDYNLIFNFSLHMPTKTKSGPRGPADFAQGQPLSNHNA